MRDSGRDRQEVYNIIVSVNEHRKRPIPEDLATMAPDVGEYWVSDVFK